MARKATAAPKAKTKPRVKFADKAQSERFIAAARELGIEETGVTFDPVFEKVVRTPKRQIVRENP